MSSFFSLKDGVVNKEYVIKSVDVEDENIKRRLGELGLYKGQYIRIAFYSSLKKTMLVCVGDSTFTLRRDIANKIIVGEK